MPMKDNIIAKNAAKRYGAEVHTIETVDMPETFWVVTFPEESSTFIDICFKTSWQGFMLQVRGGLNFEDIYGIYIAQEDAEQDAGRLLQKKLP